MTGGVHAAHVHAEPLVWTLRIYDEADGYDRRLAYRAVATVSLFGRRAWISGLHGRFDRSAWRAIEAWLRAQGVTSAAMERRGRTVTLLAPDWSQTRPKSARAPRALG